VTNSKELNQIIKNSGLKRTYIAKCLGISLTALTYKINNRYPFNARQIDLLCKLLNIDSVEQRFAIFFASEVEEQSTSA